MIFLSNSVYVCPLTVDNENKTWNVGLIRNEADILRCERDSILYYNDRDSLYMMGLFFNPALSRYIAIIIVIPDSKFIWPTWQDPGGPHVGPMNLAIWDRYLDDQYVPLAVTYTYIANVNISRLARP